MTRFEKTTIEKSLEKIGKINELETFFFWCEQNKVSYLPRSEHWIIGRKNEICVPLTFEDLYEIFEKNSREFKLKKFSDMFKETFEWGCNDTAKFLYANAIYSIITENKTYKESEQDFLDYMLENDIR